MSLLRDRAIAVSLESTLRTLRPCCARARFVSVTSVDSAAELKLLLSQANDVRGVASSPTDVRMNAIASITAKRRGSAWSIERSSRDGRRAADWTIIGGSVSCGHRLGVRCVDPRPNGVVQTAVRWSRSHRARVPERAPLCDAPPPVHPDRLRPPVTARDRPGMRVTGAPTRAWEAEPQMFSAPNRDRANAPQAGSQRPLRGRQRRARA